MANHRLLAPEGAKIKNLYISMYLKMQGLKDGEEGQDLVEYALLICLIVLAAIVGVNLVTRAITTVFSSISNSLS